MNDQDHLREAERLLKQALEISEGWQQVPSPVEAAALATAHAAVATARFAAEEQLHRRDARRSGRQR